MSDSAGLKDLPSKAVAGSEIGADADGIGTEHMSDAQAMAADGQLPAAAKVGGEPAPADGAEVGKGHGFDLLATSLRHAYESTLEEDVPDSILNLLRQLD